MVDGALWREERQRELLAWHAWHVISGFGTKKRGGAALTLQDVLGRGFIPGPHYEHPAPQATHDRPAATTPAPMRPPTPAAPFDPIKFRMEQLVRMGKAVRVE